MTGAKRSPSTKVAVWFAPLMTVKIDSIKNGIPKFRSPFLANDQTVILHGSPHMRGQQWNEGGPEIMRKKKSKLRNQAILPPDTSRPGKIPTFPGWTAKIARKAGIHPSKTERA